MQIWKFQPTSVTPAQQVKELPEQFLNVSVGKFFAERSLSLNSASVLKCQLKSKKHADATKKDYSST